MTQLLHSDDLVVAPLDGYGGTHRLLTALARQGRLRVALVDIRDAAAFDAALTARPRLVWVESPTNPLLRCVDVATVARRAHAAGALVAVDNTFLTPALQKPIALGADLVVHSTTKYLNGHSDVVGGAVVAKDAALAAELAWWANCLGITGAPFDAYLTLRGLRTLHARMRVHVENARVVAELLRSHPAVERVHFPGVGAMVSFELRGGVGAVQRFVGGLRCFTLAESLGGVESLVAHPATMTHASMDAEARRRAGISDALLRLSVGIEAVDDLRADLSLALARAAATGRVRATSRGSRARRPVRATLS